MDEPTPRPVAGIRPTRRTLLRAGAASAAAVGASQLPIGRAVAAPPGLAVASGGSPAADPPQIPGMVMRTAGVASANALNGSKLYGAPGLSRAEPSGFIDFPLQLPLGARLVRVDAYSYSSAPVTHPWRLYRHAVTSAALVVIANFETTGNGFLTSALDYRGLAQPVVGVGDELLVEIQTSTNLWAGGVVYQYDEPTDQLHLRDEPRRVYDSRPGADPAGVGPKTPLTNGTERVIDTTFGGAVPAAGATSVLVNLTATFTDAGGFLSAFKNGTAWPGTSTLNWDHANTNVGNLAMVPVDASSRFKVRCAGRCDMVVDVLGWFG